ncbi:hypothetical protein C8F01DRAFT_1078501 [Mycena amicta]|nr:hypothetical protein C8F01DRAFT_1078501 [Mycena amicta]
MELPDVALHGFALDAERHSTTPLHSLSMPDLPPELLRLTSSNVDDQKTLLDLRTVSGLLSAVATPACILQPSSYAIAPNVECGEQVTSVVREVAFRGDPASEAISDGEIDLFEAFASSPPPSLVFPRRLPATRPPTTTVPHELLALTQPVQRGPPLYTSGSSEGVSSGTLRPTHNIGTTLQGLSRLSLVGTLRLPRPLDDYVPALFYDPVRLLASSDDLRCPLHRPHSLRLTSLTAGFNGIIKPTSQRALLPMTTTSQSRTIPPANAKPDDIPLPSLRGPWCNNQARRIANLLREDQERRWTTAIDTTERRFQITVTFPPPRTGFDESMSGVHFKSMELKSALAAITAEDLVVDDAVFRTSLAAIKIRDTATLTTALGRVEGTYNVTKSLSITTSNAAINVDVNLVADGDDEQPGKVHLITSNAYVYLAFLLRFSDYPSAINANVSLILDFYPGAFDGIAHTANGHIDLAVPALPLDALLTLHASTALAKSMSGSRRHTRAIGYSEAPCCSSIGRLRGPDGPDHFDDNDNAKPERSRSGPN